MKKMILKVPKGIRYISEWEGFHLPVTPTIIDKQITGCGFTEYCISCPQDVIICSPRIILLENKEDQHKGELYYVRNNLEYIISIDCEDVQKKPNLSQYDNSEDISEKVRKAAKKAEVDVEQVTADYYRRLRSSIIDYYRSRKVAGLPCKFTVTYDSFRHVREALNEIGVLDSFFVVVDEFQSIFTDSRFKSTTEIGFLNQLMDIHKLCYVSATPMLDTYLDRLEEFNQLPMIQLDWKTEDPSRVVSPQLIVRPCKSIISAIKPIIDDYKEGRFQRFVSKNEKGVPIEVLSKEIVIYVNSVKNICDIIKRFNLKLEEVNVLCARTSENRKRVRKAFEVNKKIEVLGSVPKKGEPHKMFTLCTRTVYLGADFYSTCARTVVLSDANIDCLAVDISLDLPQILGRQRLIENPWKNYAELYFKTSRNMMTRGEFDNIVRKKLEASHDLLDMYQNLPKSGTQRDTWADLVEIAAKTTHYANNYVAVDIKTGVRCPVLNTLVLVAEQRAFDVQQVDYKDRFSVFNAISNGNSIVMDTSKVDECLSILESISYFQDKLEYICTKASNYLSQEQFELFLNLVPMDFKNYYKLLGPERCRSLRYRKSELQKEYDRLFNNIEVEDIFSSEINKFIEIGKRYKKSDLKELIRNLCEKTGKNLVPKANIINDYFETKEVIIIDKDTKKRDSGFEILKRKGED